MDSSDRFLAEGTWAVQLIEERDNRHKRTEKGKEEWNHSCQAHFFPLSSIMIWEKLQGKYPSKRRWKAKQQQQQQQQQTNKKEEEEEEEKQQLHLPRNNNNNYNQTN